MLKNGDVELIAVAYPNRRPHAEEVLYEEHFICARPSATIPASTVRSIFEPLLSLRHLQFFNEEQIHTVISNRFFARLKRNPHSQ